MHANMRTNLMTILEALGSSEMSQTQLTEEMWGTSGRGSAKAVSMIRGAADLGYVNIRKAGRTFLISATIKGREFLTSCA